MYVNSIANLAAAAIFGAVLDAADQSPSTEIQSFAGDDFDQTTSREGDTSKETESSGTTDDSTSTTAESPTAPTELAATSERVTTTESATTTERVTTTELATTTERVTTTEVVTTTTAPLSPSTVTIAGPISQPLAVAPTTDPTETNTDGECHPAYQPCLEIVGDLNCGQPSSWQRPVRLVGTSDPYRLDRDGDGVGCES